ncbi:MAG: TIGR04084 family radical SAM/SPASM domain-containing protein [Candidatus Thorarchaeota archaeon]
MNYHLVLTRRCNLNCFYCHGGEETGPDTEIHYSIDDLAAFLEKDRDIQLMLYGGEPTLRVPLIIELMNRFPKARFMLQTNALLLDRIPEDNVKRFHSILVSIDGTEETTDGYRSNGVYQKVVKNVRWLREVGYGGDIVARMAVSEQSDIYRDVRHLLDMRDPSFDHVHWQLNVVWDAEDNWQDFDEWVNRSYNPGISRLVEEWVEKMETGVVEGIVPFLPLMHTLLTGDASKMRCGSGLDTFAIHVDGKIGVCPISPDWDFSIVGDIWNSEPDELKNCMLVDEPCPSCEDYEICGGRCLFANKQRLWGEEGFEKICNVSRYLFNTLKKYVRDVQNLIDNGVISNSVFEYPEFNNGCEIVP